MTRLVPAVIAVAVLVLAAVPAQAGTSCEMTFTMSGWSVFYKTSSGTGTIKCDNGQTAKVKLSAKGGGITFGRSKIKDGIGKFTEVDNISELFGSYGQGEAHAGAGKSAKASVVTKGEISLALAGKERVSTSASRSASSRSKKRTDGRRYFICSGRLSARPSSRRSFSRGELWPECSPWLEPL